MTFHLEHWKYPGKTACGVDRGFNALLNRRKPRVTPRAGAVTCERCLKSVAKRANRLAKLSGE